MRLSARAYLYFPPDDGPWPVLYEQRYADLKGASTRLARAGDVVCAENFRGAGLSEGTWVGYRALGWDDLKDGYDTVEWLAKQKWSTGKIGRFGSSQAGFAQNSLAVTQPPHLVAQYMIDIVRVSDVYPDGRSILIIDYVRRARYRHGFDREVFFEPGKIKKVAFDIGWLSQIFAKGHRIRVTVASTGAPFFEPNPNTGGPLTIEFPANTVVARNKVYHDRNYASRIVAPWRK